MSERKIFAVCDLEVNYAYHLMEYVSKKKTFPFEIRVFTSVQTLQDFLQKHPVELLLISEQAMTEEVQELGITQILILSEGVTVEKFLQYPAIYKYQSSNKVIREALACYGEQFPEKGTNLNIHRRQIQVIGIYSPVGRTMKTSFALTLGQILARNKAVLYLNLEEYSGFEYLMNQSYEQNLGDLLYYLRQDAGNLMMKLSGMVQTVNNLDYMPPVAAPGDIQTTSPEEWVRLLQEIADSGIYEVVLLDIGDGVSDLYHFLDQCTKIYMPVRNDTISQAKIRQFEELLKLWDGSSVLEKIQKLRLPYHRSAGKGGNFMEDLVWSELGDYVREFLRWEKEEKKEWTGFSGIYDRN